jgi:uncharacterized protein GlcG (DUF336 family)
MEITLEKADLMVGAARAKAAEIGIAVCVAVLDAGGNLKSFSRMDGAWLGSTDVAMKKARSSVLFEAESDAIWDACKPDAQAHGLELTNGVLVTFAGGIPLKGLDGKLAGAIGVSGGQVAQDQAIARAGAAAWPT